MSKFFKVNVSVIIFNADDKVLIQKRSETEEVFPGHWGIPGGTVEMSDNNLVEALQREVREEVGIEIEKVYLFKENIKQKELYGLVYLVFTAIHLSGVPQALEDTDQVSWMDLDEMSNLTFTPTTLDSIKNAYERKNTTDSI